MPTIVGHVGDHDEDGLDIFDSLAENGFAFLDYSRRTGTAQIESDLEFRRLALH